MTKKMMSLALVTLCATVALPTWSFAKKSESSSRNTTFTTNLVPSDSSLTDLTRAKGSLRFEGRKLKYQLKGRVVVPTTSTSLGITNATTAAAASIHLEILRDSAVINDCTLKFDSEVSESSSSSERYSYRLHVKNSGKHEVKGSCTNGAIAVKKTDTVRGYATVSSTRVDFLTSAQ